MVVQGCLDKLCAIYLPSENKLEWYETKKYCVKTKLKRNPSSMTSNMYELKPHFLKITNWKSSLYFRITFRWCLTRQELSHHLEKPVTTYIIMWISVIWVWYDVYIYWAQKQHTIETNSFGTRYLLFPNQWYLFLKVQYVPWK